jgi:hypothetical protein
VLVLVAGAGGPDNCGQLHHRGLDRRPVAALTGDQYEVAVLGSAHADRLQATVAADRLGPADRLGHLLELPVVLDFSARVEPVGDGLSRGRQYAVR